MGIGVLGPLHVDGGIGGLSPRDRVVVAALAMRAGDLVSAEQLAEALWGDTPPATWTKSLQGSIVRIRKVLGATNIETADHGYRLALPASVVDSREFERLVARGRELLGLDEPERASYALGEALELWRGDALAELQEWEPGRQEADRLTELRRDAEELRLDAALRCGRHREVLVEARRLIEQAPLRERRWELLALAQYRSGQQADALRTLQRLRRVLVEELGIDPGHDALALEQAILRQEPSLLPEFSVAQPSDTCPYLGLVPYDVDDTDSYFGRDDDLEACRRRLAETGVLAVVGPSGSGKSSLVRAGLAAALRRDGERVVVITPGRRPMEALSALPTTGRPVVLVVDQAEEAVTLGDDPVELAAFFEALTRHARRGRLVVALRADRLGDIAAHPEFARLVEQGLYLLTPMTGAALRQAIEGPARQAGLRLEPGLVELLVAEVEGQPGALPLLSHALRQTWERREGGVLTLDGYRATGGIRDAVARSAEQVYDDLPDEQRTMLRDLMLRLVTPGPEGEPVRSRIPRRLLTTDTEHDRVMERLVAARLVTSDDGVVELAHEVLAHAWPRLRGWLDEDTDGQRILRHLSVAADTWDAMGRPDDELYRGMRLGQALEWRDRVDPDLTPVETAYLAAAQHRVRRNVQSVLAQARYQARVNRRLRGLLVGAALLLVMAVVAGTLAVRQAHLASEATRTADARRVAAQAQLVGDVDRSLALAAAAFRAEPSAESRVGLLAALTRTPQLAAIRPMPGPWLDVSPDGRTLATMDGTHQVRFFDAESHEQLGEYDPYPDRDVEGIGGNLAPLAFTRDGSTLAMALLAVDDGAVRLLDTSTHEPLEVQPGGQPRWAHTNDVDFSRDGRFLAASVSVFEDGLVARYLVYVWDLTRPAQPVHRIEVPSDTFHVEFSPEGRRIHAAPGWNSDSPPGTWTYSVRTGELVGTSPNGGQSLESSPDGHTLAYGDGSTVVVVDERTRTVRNRLTEPQDLVERISFSPDGAMVAAVTDDPAAFVWDVGTGRLLERIELETQAEAADFDRSGRRLLVPYDGRLNIFDLTGKDRYLERVRADSDALPEAFEVRYASPYEDVVAVSTWRPARGVSLLEVSDRTTEERVSDLGLSWVGNRSDAHAWSPDGHNLAWIDSDDRLRVHDWRTGEQLAGRRLPGGQLAYADDGTRLFVAGPRGFVLLDAGTLRPETDPVAIEDNVVLAELGPGDDTAVVISAQATTSPFGFTAADRWTLLDLRTGEALGSGRLREPATSMAVSPDRTGMAVAGTAGVEIVDLRAGTSTTAPSGGGTAESEGYLLTYSPDGRLLASSDDSGRVSLWDGRTAELLGTVQPGDTRAEPVFLDDERLLLQYFDGASYIWDTSEEHAVDTACRIVGRGLTPDEWRSAFGSRPYVDVCG